MIVNNNLNSIILNNPLILNNLDKILFIFYGGSRAIGLESTESDYDIAIITTEEVPALKGLKFRDENQTFFAHCFINPIDSLHKVLLPNKILNGRLIGLGCLLLGYNKDIFIYKRENIELVFDKEIVYKQLMKAIVLNRKDCLWRVKDGILEGTDYQKNNYWWYFFYCQRNKLDSFSLTPEEYLIAKDIHDNWDVSLIPENKYLDIFNDIYNYGVSLDVDVSDIQFSIVTE